MYTFIVSKYFQFIMHFSQSLIVFTKFLTCFVHTDDTKRQFSLWASTTIQSLYPCWGRRLLLHCSCLGWIPGGHVQACQVIKPLFIYKTPMPSQSFRSFENKTDLINLLHSIKLSASLYWYFWKINKSISCFYLQILYFLWSTHRATI